MSSGSFILVGYSASTLLGIYRLWIQPETQNLKIGAAFNTPAGPPAEILEFRAGGDRRSLGLHCRMINFRFLGGSVPSGYKEGATLTLPWLRNNKTFRELVRGEQGEYLGFPVIITGSLPEIAR
jgi:hypothetical protein